MDDYPEINDDDLLETTSTPQPKRKNRSFPNETLKAALDDIREGLNCGEASRKYGVPIRTLQRIAATGSLPTKKGRSAFISAESEQIIVKWCIENAELGDPVTKDELLLAAAEIANAQEEENKFKNGIPTGNWTIRFLARHPEISFRKPQAVTRASANVTKQNVIAYINGLIAWFDKKGLNDMLLVPSAFCNGDETGFELGPLPKRVIAAKGAKNVYIVEPGNSKENITVMYNFLASGESLTPQIIIKRSPKTLKAVTEACLEIGAKFHISTSEKGWQTQETFYEYVTERLVKDLDKLKIVRTAEHPFFYFLDGHRSHISMKLFEWCQQNHIFIVCFLPNATRILQMCDVAVNSPAKNCYTKEVLRYKRETGTREIRTADFVKILQKVNEKVLRKETIVNGFRATGIFPLNPNNIHLDRAIGGEANEVSSLTENIAAESPDIEMVVIELPEVSPDCESSIEMALNISEEPQNQHVDPRETMNEIRAKVISIRELSHLDDDQRLVLAVIDQQAKIFIRSLKDLPVQKLLEKPPLESVLKKRMPYVRSGQHRNYKIKNHGVLNDDDMMEKRRGIEDEKEKEVAGKENRKNARNASKVLKRVMKREPKDAEPLQKRVCTQPLFSAPSRLARASKNQAKMSLKEVCKKL